MKYYSLATVLVSLLSCCPLVNSQICSGNQDIDIANGGITDYDCGSFDGPVRLVWKVTGNTGFLYNDEYSVELKQDGTSIYTSQEFDDENIEGRSDLVGGSGGNYQVSIRCRNEAFDCTYGRLQYKLVRCGCEGNGDLVVLTPCNGDSFAAAEDAVCGSNCETGFYSDPSTGCTECPNFKIITTSQVAYDNLVGIEQCGVQGTTGFWALAKTGSVAADGTVISWSLTRSQSASDGVERTNDFSRAYGQVRGSSTSFETSVSVGFSASVSAGLFGSGVEVESSVEQTTTIGQTKSFEISTESTNAIGNAVSSVITNDESITCEQTCGPNPDNPDDVQGFIYNWVDAVFEEQTSEILHYVRTCATVCKYDNIPPLCPPGKCFNRACDVCEKNSFLLSELDELASQVPPTPAPTRIRTPTPAPTTSSNGGPGCFSKNTKVMVQNRGLVAMDELRVGDLIMNGKGTYEPVYSFAHRAPKTNAEFVQIHTNSKGSDPLEMTGEHLIFVVGKTHPIRADSIKVGDMLQAQDGFATARKVKIVNTSGLYNPLTASGTILVNGIIASNYVSFQKENNEYVELQGGNAIPLSHHNFAHLVTSPYRLFCTTIMTCDDAYDVTESGLPYYVSGGMDLIEWGKEQHIMLQGVVLVSIMLICVAFMIADHMLCGVPIYQVLVPAILAWRILSRPRKAP